MATAKPSGTRYGPTNDGMAVGEQRGDGMNLKYMVPFELDDDVREVLSWGATATLKFRIWIVSELGSARARGRSRRR